MFFQLLLVTFLGFVVADTSNRNVASPPKPGHWVDIWASMPQLVEYNNLPNTPFNTSTGVFPNTTIRQTVQIKTATDRIRLRLSNNFGVGDLTFTAASIALPVNGSGDSRVQAKTVKPLSFGGNSSITIPGGTLAISDSIDFKVQALQTISISIYLATGQPDHNVTGHPGSRATSFYSFGNQVNAADITGPSAQSIAHWYYISAIEGWEAPSASAFVIVGDSITDGRGSITDGNTRWPDLVQQKLIKNRVSGINVINQAAGGNQILHDGLGPAAIGRIDRDVLAQSGVKYAMLFEGVNDIGTTATTTEAQRNVGDRLIQAYKQISTRIHALGVPLFAATITPFCAPPNFTDQPYSNAIREQTRIRINNFILHSGTFDYVIDFAKILADPRNSSLLNPKYNSGDYLHPNTTGYQAIADAFPIDIFTRFADGIDSPS